MGEREPNNETIGRGQLFYLWHPEAEQTFSGYGITVEENNRATLVGLLMVDRPFPADEEWLRGINETFGECRLVPMTATGERGLACQMEIDPESVEHLRTIPSMKSLAIQSSLRPLLEKPPKPKLRLSWDEDRQVWASEFDIANELPDEIRRVFERTGYGFLPSCWNSIRVRLKTQFRSRTWIVLRKQKAHPTRQASH